jgi:hypothetical protein
VSTSLVVVIALLGQAPLEFVWNAPASCPSSDIVRARLGALAGTASATITERSSGWELEVRVNETVRALVSKSCEEAADAAVLIIQLALGEQPSVVVEPPVLEQPVTSPTVEAPAWRFHAALHVGGALGWLPQPLGHLGASFSAERRALVLLVRAQTSLPQRYTASMPADAAVDLHLLVEGQLGACWAFSVGRVRLGPCAVIGLGALSVAGRNVIAPRTSTIAVFNGGPGVRATVPLGSWFELSGGLFGRATARPQVSFEGFPTVVEGFWAGAEAFVGAGGTF